MTPTVTLFERPVLRRHAPKRSASHFYQAAVDDPRAVAGVDLDTIESRITAAVRLAYRVAQSLEERSTRLAKRVRAAGDQATGGSSDTKRSDRRALDATEQLIFKTMMSGLAWLEGAAADRGNPIRRAATAQFQLLGSMLGLLPTQESSAGEPPRTEHAPGRQGAEPGIEEARHSRPTQTLQIRYTKTERRPVRLVDSDLTGLAGARRTLPLTFYGGRTGRTSFEGELESRGTGYVLTVRPLRTTPVGVYRAAVCNDEDVQVGFIEMAL
jgi:hypothetical protein